MLHTSTAYDTYATLAELKIDRKKSGSGLTKPNDTSKNQFLVEEAKPVRSSVGPGVLGIVSIRLTNLRRFLLNSKCDMFHPRCFLGSNPLLSATSAP